MTDRKMIDRKMIDRKMIDRKMIDRKMIDRKMTDRKMTDRKMIDRKMTDRKMTEGNANHVDSDRAGLLPSFSLLSLPSLYGNELNQSKENGRSDFRLLTSDLIFLSYIFLSNIFLSNICPLCPLASAFSSSSLRTFSLLPPSGSSAL
jgi:hypothetical protein